MLSQYTITMSRAEYGLLAWYLFLEGGEQYASDEFGDAQRIKFGDPNHADRQHNESKEQLLPWLKPTRIGPCHNKRFQIFPDKRLHAEVLFVGSDHAIFVDQVSHGLVPSPCKQRQANQTADTKDRHPIGKH